jgi:hypothetical protein
MVLSTAQIILRRVIGLVYNGMEKDVEGSGREFEQNY